MRFDRLDRTVLITLVSTIIFVALLLLRGDQVGVQITRINPADNTTNIPQRGRFTLAFNENMLTRTLEGKVQLSPPVSGTLQWNGNAAAFVPAVALQPDTSYTLTIQPGASSIRGRTVLKETIVRFRTSHPRLLYLSPASGTPDLFLQDVNTPDPPQRLTSEPYGVWDFAVSPDSTRIVYSARRDTSDARDLWLINSDGSGRQRLVTCDEQVCQSPSWSADSTRIAFERRNLIKGAIGKTPGPARIWIVDVTNSQAVPLLEDSQKLGSLPRWAPVGDKLAYFDPTDTVVTVLDTVKLERVQLPSVLGDSGAWSPDATQLIYPELQALENGSFYQLLRADLVRNVITTELPLAATNDASATWSPDGNKIAFTRRASTTAAGTGAQIWLKSAGAADPAALTRDAGFTYGALGFSSDGNWLTALRFNLTEPNAQPEVWLLRLDGTDKRLIASNATQPAWLP